MENTADKQQRQWYVRAALLVNTFNIIISQLFIAFKMVESHLTSESQQKKNSHFGFGRLIYLLQFILTHPI